MGRRIVAIIVLLVVVAGGYVIWKHHKEDQELTTGEVHGIAQDSAEERSDRKAHTAPEDDAAAGASTSTAAPVTLPAVNSAAPKTDSAAPPTTDTVAPNPPNGMLFGGKGTYQWYRQGNLTWRVDTVSGRSCIVFATMEEWRKQIVYSHGCGRNA